MKKKAVSGIMLTLLVISVLTLAFNIQPAKAEPKTWYVDDDGGADFTKIQDAIYAATAGDTIYVYNGMYYEHLYIDESLTLVGENKYATIIDGSGWTTAVVEIGHTQNVNLNGFTIQNSGYGILVRYSNNNRFFGNIISNIGVRGIELYPDSWNNMISGNTISDITGYPAPPGVTGRVAIYLSRYGNIIEDNIISRSQVGVYLAGPPETWSHDNTVVGNVISDLPGDGCGINVWGYNNRIIENVITMCGYVGIQLDSPSGHPNGCKGNVVRDNVISESTFGINLIMASVSNTITRNSVSNNQLGILLSDQSDDNRITMNLVSSSYYGILLFSSNNTEVYHNNFIDNTLQVLLSDSFNTAWDDGYPVGGNYWSDYLDEDIYGGPNQDEPDSDKIWDHPYVIDGDSKDHYPLVEPWEIVSATLDIYPETLNAWSLFGRFITVYIELPEGYKVSSIDVSTVRLNGEVQAELHPTKIGDYDMDGIPDLMVKFDRTDVVRSISRTGENTLTITGTFTGKSFKGTYTIKVVH